MTGWLLLLASWGLCAWAATRPDSAWLEADRSKVFWVALLALPVINVFAAAGFLVGVLVPLLRGSSTWSRSPFRRRVS